MIVFNRGIVIICSTVIMIALVNGCSNKLNTWTSRQYHMATTRWNVYFNGKESLRKGQELIVQNHVENFDELLPVYRENNIRARETASSEMGRAVDKAVKAIELHSITAKPKRKKGKRASNKYREFRRKKEYNNMIDECYLLLGKAQFYRREYYSTERTFRYILRTYQEKPVHYEAAIWYARTLAEQDKYFRALRTLDDVMKEEGFPEKLIPMVRTAKVDLFIRKGFYDGAIGELRELVRITNKSQGQTRYYYLLAQLYTRLEDFDKAQLSYTELVETHPEYDYVFHAKLSKALLYENYRVPEASNKIKTELQKLIKDRRNARYLDKVYYTLARIFEKEDKIDRAEENYLQSLENNQDNAKQRAKTLIALGDLYFDRKKEYALAMENYKEAADLVTEAYPKYEEIKLRLNALTKLAENLRIVIREDSLRRIASLPVLEREQLIKRMMITERESFAKKNRKIKKVVKESLKPLERPIGKWYFYNPMAVARGKKEFVSKWGTLNLTDNWRKNPEIFRLSVKARNKRAKDTLQFHSYEDYISDLPLTEASYKESEQKSYHALYEAAVIYEDEMDDYLEAKRSFEEVLKRNIDNSKKRLRANYHLYILNSLLDNWDEAQKYKNIVLKQFPNSDLAKVLNDPGYYKKKVQKGEEASVLYEQAYAAYASKDFQRSKELSKRGITYYERTSFLQRFVFLNAMAKAYTESPEQLKVALQKVKEVATDEKLLITTQAILKKIAEGKTPNQEIGRESKVYTVEDFENLQITVQDSVIPPIQAIEIPKSYRMEVNAKHYFALVLPRDLKAGVEAAIEEFHKINFTDKKLRIRRRNFSLNTDIILITSFSGKEEALQYFARMMVAQKDFLKAINEVDYTNLIISENNLTKLLSDREILPYLDFYAYNYLGKVQELQKEQVTKDSKEVLLHTNLTKVDTADLQSSVNYVYDPRAMHHFVLIVPHRGVDANYLWTALHHFDKQYRVKKERIDRKRMFVVQNVGNQEGAMSYLKKIIQVDYIYGNLQEVSYRNFIITDENLKLLRSTNATANYVQFFKENYLRK